MATAFAMMEQYSNWRETVVAAADKAKAAAEKVRVQVAEQTKGLTLQTSLARAKDQLLGMLPEQLGSQVGSVLGQPSPLLGLEEGRGQGAAAQQGQGKQQGQQQGKQQGQQGKGEVQSGLAKQQTPAPATEDSSQPLLEELNQACNLTFKQRVYGFASCLSLGFFCCLLSLVVLFSPVKFGLSYSLGNLLCLGSTGFLIGFKRQLTMMFDPVRRGAALVFIVMAVVTLLVALLVQDPLLSLVCILIQGSALLWYSLSYIPYAQAAAKRLARLFFTSEV